MKNFKRGLSLILAIILIFGAFPLSASSAEATNENVVEELLFSDILGDACYNTDDTCTLTDALKGEGTYTSPFLINTRGDLLLFAEKVNSGDSKYNTEGVCVKLTVNIDMSGKAWTPIGYSTPFLGIFDGDNHEVINFTLNSDLESASEKPNYIGFFGCIKNAEIKNFGIFNYKVDYDYDFDSTIGALVGFSENSKITNCYANGDIDASFKNTNPLYRNDVITYKPLTESEIPTEITAEKSVGQGVILDMSGIASFSSTTNLTVSGDVTALKIISNPNTINTNFSITVEAHSKYDFYLELENIYIYAPVNTDAIKVEGGRNIQIVSNNSANSSNSIRGGNATADKPSGMAINAFDSTVIVSGNANITITGGRGFSGVYKYNPGGSGQEGTNGNCSVTAKELFIENAKSVYLLGGDGGNGADGNLGKYGVDGACAKGQVRGEDGQDGGNGGNGGNGAIAVNLTGRFVVNNADVTVTAGSGGNGGNGGTAGKGGNGSIGYAKWDVGFDSGRGGDGGNGGNGGNGGDGGMAIKATQITVNADSFYAYAGMSGAGGEGGNGGDGGRGADGDTENFGSNWSLADGRMVGKNGGDGGDVGCGGNGGDNGKFYNALSTDNLYFSNNAYIYNGKKYTLRDGKTVIPYYNYGGKKGTTAGTNGAAGKFYNVGWGNRTVWGSAGVKGSTEKYDNGTAITNGTPGNMGEYSPTEPRAIAYTGGKKYEIFADVNTFDELSSTNLMCVNYSDEQQILLLLMLESFAYKCWLGGTVECETALDTKFTLNWTDGMYFRIDGQGAGAFIRAFDSEGNVVGDRLSNLQEGYPLNSKAGIYGLYADLDAVWYTSPKTSAMQYYATEEEFSFTNSNSNDISPETLKLSKADIVLGGLVGEADNESIINLSASTVNSLSIDTVSDLNTIVNGGLLGKNLGVVNSSIAANCVNGSLSLCDNPFGAQNGTVTDGFINILENSKDANGVPYGAQNISYDNPHNTKILRECSVQKTENSSLSGDIKIPDYVFEGRAISAVTRIADSAFEDCNAISTIHLGNLVKTVGTGILKGCSLLNKITIGKSLEKIPEYTTGEQLFGLIKSDEKVKYRLSAYEVETENKYFSAIEGVLFATQYIDKFDKKIEICVIDSPVCKEFSSSFVLPELVVRIAPYAFQYSKIQSVDLSYIREVGDYAFMGAQYLTAVRFAETDDSNNKTLQDYFDENEVYYAQLIGDEAFAYCHSLTSVNLDSSFIQKIGKRAFISSGNGIEITLGKNIKVIGENAFSSALGNDKPARIESFNVDDANERYLSIDGVLYERLEDGSLKLLQYPILKTGENRDGVFYKSEFSIPDTDDNGNTVSVSVIEDHAFYKTEELYTANIELTGLGEIGAFAFAESQLRRINIGAGVKSIGDTGDDDDRDVFNACSHLESINVDEKNEFYADKDGVLFDKDIELLICYPAARNEKSYKVPESVTQVWSRAFFGSQYLSFITFSNRLINLGEDPFNESHNLIGIYFKDCYTPVNYNNNPFKTGNSSTKVYYTKGYYDNSDTAKGWNIFEKTYNISEYVPPFLQEGKAPVFYTIAVMNEKGMPLDDVLVSLVDCHSNLDSAYTVEGVRVFTDTYDAEYGVGFDIDYKTAYALRITDKKGVYFGYENSEFYLDEAMGISYITLSSVPTVSGINVSYRCKKPEDVAGDMWAAGQADTNFTFIQGAYYTADINSEVAKVNTEIVDSFTIKVGCTSDTSSSIVGYRLLQGDKILYTYNGNAILCGENGYAPLEFTLKTKDIATEKEIKAEVTFSDKDGKTTVISKGLNIQILKLELLALDLSWASNEIKLVIDKDIPFIGGAELSLSEFNKSKINIAIGPDYFRLLIGNFGNEDIKLDNEYFESNYDRHWGQIFTKDKNRRIWEDENVDKVGLTVGGYIEIKYTGLDTEGNPDFDLTSSITGNLKYTYADGITRTIGIVPVRLEYKLELGAEATFKLSYDFDTNSLYAPNLQFKVEGSFSAYAGIGCKLASAGVYGNISSMMLWDIAPQFELNKWTLKGDLGAYVKYNGLFLKFEKKWSLFEALKWNNEWVIYNKEWINETTDGWGNKKVTKRYALAVADYYSQENYSVATSDDLGDYSAIEPQLIQLDDTHILLVYADNLGDISGYDEYNYQKLVYRIYDTTTSTYTTPQIIDDIRDTDGNGFADGMFVLKKIDGSIYLAYTQMTERLTAEDSDNVAAYVSALEVKTAVWNNEASKFENFSFVSDNDCYDTALTMGEVDGAPAIVWIENGENDITGITQNNNMAIMCSRFVDGVWETYAVAENLPSITDLAVFDGTIAYITDQNNDLFTAVVDGEAIEGYNDRVIVSLDSKGNVISSTVNADAYHDISVLGDGIVYYRANKLYNLETNIPLFDEAISNLSEAYKVLYNENGDVRGILYTDNMAYDSANGENGSNIFGVFCANGIWGMPIQLTDYGIGNYVSSFDVVELDGKLIVSSLVTQISDTYNSDSQNDIVTVNEFKSEIIEYPQGYTTEKPEFIYEEIAPESDLTVNIPVTNNGINVLKADDIALTLRGVGAITRVIGFYDSDGNYLENGLPSGESGKLRIIYRTSTVSSTEPTLTVGDTDYNLELWYSDLAVSAKQVWLNGMPYIAVSVYNLGLASAQSGFEISLGENTIHTGETKLLSHGEREHFLIRINPELLKGEAEMLTVNLNVNGEYMLGNNSTSVTFNSDADIPLGELIYDINGDGKTNIRDLVHLKKVLAGTAEESRESDINFDGVISSLDLGTLKRMLLVGVFELSEILNS